MLIFPAPGRLALIEHWLEGQHFLLPAHIRTAAVAITSERVAAPGTVTRAAASSTEAPVPGQAAVTAWPRHARLAGAVTGAGITEGARSQGECGRSQWVAGAGFASIWGREGLSQVSVEARLAALAVLPFCVVLTAVTDTTTAVA